MNDSASTVGAVSIRRPPPSTYLWTADGRIRRVQRDAAPGRAAPPEEKDVLLDVAAE